MGSRVLLVDDDALTREVIGAELASDGFEVVKADSAAAAAEVLSGAEPPRLLVLDWLMPGLDGLEFFRTLRRVEGAPYTILLTARSRAEDLLEALAVGVDDFLPKPVDARNLTMRLRVGERLLGSLPGVSASVRCAVAEAAAGGTGRVMVREGPVVGRIGFWYGQVVSAHLSAELGSILDLVRLGTELSPEETAAVMDESRKRDLGPTDILLEWGLISEDLLAQVLRAWLRKELHILFSLGQAQGLFLPTTRPASQRRVRFAIEELLSPQLFTLLTAKQAAPDREVDLDPAACAICDRVLKQVIGGQRCLLVETAGMQILGSSFAGDSPVSRRQAAVEARELMSALRLPGTFERAVVIERDRHWAARRLGDRAVIVEAGLATPPGLLLSSLRDLDLELFASAPRR